MAKTEKTMLRENKIIRQALFLYELFDNSDFEEKLMAASSDLSQKKQDILRMYYVDFLTFEEIAEFYQISREQVRQILRDSINKIKQSPNKRYFEYGVALKEYADQVNDKIQDNAAMLIWLNRTEHILDELAEKSSIKIEDTDLSDGLKERLLGAKYEMVKDISTLDVQRIVEGMGHVLRHIPCYNQIPIEEMGFTARTYNCLNRGGCHNLADICSQTKSSLMKIRNMGIQSMQEVLDVVAKYGYYLQE